MEVFCYEWQQYYSEFDAGNPFSTRKPWKVTTAIGLAGGDIGEIETIKVGPNYTMRNITVQVEHEEQLTEILEVIRNLKEGIHLHTVSDDVLAAHEGGKIRMKSKMPIRSLADLRRVYTPGVANVCELIKEEPQKRIFIPESAIRLQL